MAGIVGAEIGKQKGDHQALVDGLALAFFAIAGILNVPRAEAENCLPPRRRTGECPTGRYGIETVEPADLLAVAHELGIAIMLKLILVIVAGMAVASCITSADLALRHCREEGIKPATQEFNQCYYTTRDATEGFLGDNTPIVDPQPSSPYGPYRPYE